MPVTATSPPASVDVDDIVHRDRIERDARRRRNLIQRVELGVARRRAVARTVRRGHAGVHRQVAVGQQAAARDVDAERAAGHRAGVGDAVDRHGHRVAVLDIAAHRAGHRYVAAGFRDVDDIVHRDRIERDARRRRNLIQRVELGVARRRAVARTVRRGHAGVHRQVAVGQQAAARDVDAERAAGHRAGVVDAVDRHGHRVAVLDIAAHRAGHRYVAAGFRRC